jgi:hypothetical protein
MARGDGPLALVGAPGLRGPSPELRLGIVLVLVDTVWLPHELLRDWVCSSPSEYGSGPRFGSSVPASRRTFKNQARAPAAIGC